MGSLSKNLNRSAGSALLVLFGLVGSGGSSIAQQGDRAALDMAGLWVSVVTEDWKYRMVTPDKGVYNGIPLNAEGRSAADAWTAPTDDSEPLSCRYFGAPAILRIPGRVRIDWADRDTLRIETDAGSQTRRLRFDAPAGASLQATQQGFSAAEWISAPNRDPGSLKVVTNGLLPGFLRMNGVPYSGETQLTEYFNRHTAPNGDEWLVVTTVVDDPVYLSRHYVTSSHFKRLDDDRSWSPSECSVEAG